MKNRNRLGPLALAAAIASPPLLAGCARLGAPDAPATSEVPHRSASGRIGIAQVSRGGAPRFELCPVDACPKLTPKTLALRAGVLPALPAGASLALKEPAASASLEAVRETLPAPRPAAKTIIVTFASESALLTAAARRELAGILPEARRSSAIEIRGRTDERGSAAFNDLLARDRALAVRDYLRAQNLPEATTLRLSFKGACCYVAGNDTAEGRAANRRVEIEWQPVMHVAQRSAS